MLSAFLRKSSIRDMRVSSARLMSVISLSNQEAVEKFLIINSKSVLYFTAQWCGPCRQVGPIVEEMSKNYSSVAFGKVDVDENADAAVEFEISAVPTFITFDGDKVVNRFSGADPKLLEDHVTRLSKQ